MQNVVKCALKYTNECQKSAKNPMQKLPKNLLKIWHSQKSFMSEKLSGQKIGQKLLQYFNKPLTKKY